MDLLLIHICLIGFGICLGAGVASAFLLHKAKKEEQFVIDLFHHMESVNPCLRTDLAYAMERVDP